MNRVSDNHVWQKLTYKNKTLRVIIAMYMFYDDYDTRIKKISTPTHSEISGIAMSLILIKYTKIFAYNSLFRK